MDIVKATDARKEWSAVLDKVIREKPVIIERTRDRVWMSDLNILIYFLDAYKFDVKEYHNSDGTITLILQAPNLSVTAGDLVKAKNDLVKILVEHAHNYYDNYNCYISS